MDKENIKWLTTVPATDGNFISHLRMATDEEIVRQWRKEGTGRFD